VSTHYNYQILDITPEMKLEMTSLNDYIYIFILYREWFGSSSFFEHPSPASASTLQTHFPTIFHQQPEEHYTPHVIPSNRGETISQLHDRVATTLAAIIADVDAEIDAWEASSQPPSSRRATSKAILICSHAAPLIAMGRVLTGAMPEDVNKEDFNVFTAGLSTFVRRRKPSSASTSTSTFTAEDDGRRYHLLAPGTKLIPSHLAVPDWTAGKGVGGGWDCVANGDCSFLSGGAERGW
jgi:transcription factor C subunit 7